MKHITAMGLLALVQEADIWANEPLPEGITPEVREAVIEVGRLAKINAEELLK